MRVSFFVRNDLRELLPLPVHDATIAPDITTSITLNYKWRVFIVSSLEILQSYNAEILDDAELDSFNSVYDVMLEDLYS